MRVTGTLEGWLSLTIPSFTYKDIGEYSCRLRMTDGHSAIVVLNTIDGMMAQAQAKNRVEGSPEFLPYEIDGMSLVLKFKAAGIQYFGGQAVTFSLPVVGEDALPSDEFNDMAAGSRVTIDFTPKAWSADFGLGVSLQMNGIMVHDLVHFFGNEPGIPDVTGKY